MNNKILATALMAVQLFFSSPAIASNNQQLVGKVTYKYYLFSVYEARLFAPNKNYTGQAPYSLELEYFREISSEDLEARTIEGIEDQKIYSKAQIKSWQTQLKGLFPTVKDGDTISAKRVADDKVQIILNGKQIGQLDGKDLCEAFMGIWLNPKSSNPDFTQALLGK